MGLKGYVTNFSADVMPAGEVIASYHDLWKVGASFRMSKSDLRARPIFSHTLEAIEAHLTIVFTALALSREVQGRTGLVIRSVARQRRPLRSATVAINGSQQAFPPAVPTEKQTITTPSKATTLDTKADGRSHIGHRVAERRSRQRQ